MILSNWDSGAKISSNSWGSPNGSLYDGSAQAYDAGVRDADPGTNGNQELIYVFAAGNQGASENTIGSPGTGKNVITVGATENLRPFPPPPDNLCGTDPADDPHNVVAFSSRGPAQGQRVKPDVVAPGTHIQAGASVFSGYDGADVCVKYFPESPPQQIFTYSSGTSHSTPAVAGIASLAYWWIEHGGAGSAAGSVDEIGGHRAPSPALMKAWLIDHPSYLDGSGANDDLPSYGQGYGMPNMADMFSDTPKFIDDQSTTFDNTGETRTYTLGIADPTQPVRVTLAYTDAPGALGVGSIVNDLDLDVVANGRYLSRQPFRSWRQHSGRQRRPQEQCRSRVPADGRERRHHDHGDRRQHRGRRRTELGRFHRPGLRARLQQLRARADLHADDRQCGAERVHRSRPQHHRRARRGR